MKFLRGYGLCIVDISAVEHRNITEGDTGDVTISVSIAAENLPEQASTSRRVFTSVISPSNKYPKYDILKSYSR